MTSIVLRDLATYGPERCEQLDYPAAAAYAQQLVRAQYENFTVVSWFLPARLREDFANVYAFCRWADDLGDETGDQARSLELLEWWRAELDACYAGNPRHPVFVALSRTIEKADIPREPFDHLIDAFVQDQTVTRYDTWEQVLDYCTRSANPVGRLVLYLAGHRDERRQRLADATCTALQLANFWQDVRRDIIERNRVYIPADVASKHGLDLTLMVQAVALDAPRSGQACKTCVSGVPNAGITALLPAYRQTVHELVDRTWPLFEEGRELLPLLDREVRLDIRLFSMGGESVLRMIRRRRYDTLTTRPSVSAGAKARLMLQAFVCKIFRLG